MGPEGGTAARGGPGRRLRRNLRLSARLTGARQAPPREPGDRVAFTGLGSALMRLPLREREVLVLYYFADMTAERITAERGCRPGRSRPAWWRAAGASNVNSPPTPRRRAMRDDELRDGMAAWLGPVQQAPAPDVGVIRRRLRRRRARQAAAGTVLCALAAAGALTLAQGSAGPAPDTGPGPAVHPSCRASQLRVGPAAVLVGPTRSARSCSRTHTCSGSRTPGTLRAR